MTATTVDVDTLSHLVTELERKVPARMQAMRTRQTTTEFMLRTNEYAILLPIANAFVRWMDGATLPYGGSQVHLDEIRNKVQQDIRSAMRIVDDDLHEELLCDASTLYSVTPEGANALYRRLFELDRYFEEL